MAIKGYSAIPQISSITGALLSDCFVSYPGHLLAGGLTHLQRSSRCILQLHLTGPQDTRLGRVSYPSTEMQLTYSTALPPPAGWASNLLRNRIINGKLKYLKSFKCFQTVNSAFYWQNVSYLSNVLRICIYIYIYKHSSWSRAGSSKLLNSLLPVIPIGLPSR